MNKQEAPKVIAKRISKLLRKQRPDSQYIKKVFSYIREDLQISGAALPPKRLPELLTDDELQQFYQTVWNDAKRSHVILIKMLLFTGIRNAEASNLLLTDVDINNLKIRIQQGKGGKDRYVLIPQHFQGELMQFVASQKDVGNKFLFETNRHNNLSPRWIRKIIKHYALKAGISKRIYPHLFRHHLLTFLTQRGIIDSKIQQLSGHSDRKSLAIYQNMTLADVESEYQAAMKIFPIK
jgi:integrase/recombinase XerD